MTDFMWKVKTDRRLKQCDNDRKFQENAKKQWQYWCECSGMVVLAVIICVTAQLILKVIQ